MRQALSVLLSAYACLPNAGTEPGNGWNWSIQLAERGMKVCVLTTVENRSRIEAYREEHPDARINYLYVDIPARFFKECTGPHYALWQWSALKVARAFVKSNRVDIVHHVTFGSVHVPTQLWRLGIPTIFGPVGGGQTAPRKMLPLFGKQRRSEQLRTLLTKALIYSPWHRRWMKKMQAVLVSNTETLALVRAMGRQDVRLHFDVGVPESFFASEPRNFLDATTTCRLLWVGRMVSRKALPFTLECLARVQQSFCLRIIGEGIEEAELRKMIAELGLTDKVIWEAKRAPWSEVRSAYQQSDVLLFASLREAGGAQLLEAMALGLPVITLDHHGPRDLVPDGAGIKVPVTNPSEVAKALALAVDEFVKLPASAKQSMSDVGLTFARKLSWNAHAAWAESLYREVLGMPDNSRED